MKDDYPTCAQTYVTLRIYHDTSDPVFVTDLLGIQPSSSQLVGTSYEARGKARVHKLSGWFLSSEDFVESYDSEKHLDWLLSRIEPLRDSISKLRNQGWRFDIACLWDSESGHGGPTLSPRLLNKLSEAEITLWFDVYFHGAYLNIQEEKNLSAISSNGAA